MTSLAFTSGPSVSLGLNPNKTFVFSTTLKGPKEKSWDKKLVFEVPQGQVFIVNELDCIRCDRGRLIVNGATLLGTSNSVSGGPVHSRQGIAVQGGSKLELYVEEPAYSKGSSGSKEVSVVLSGHLMKE